MPAKLLCVDDEDNLLEMFRRTLGREFRLYTASNAEQALEILRDHTDIAVILSDYHMPGLNGIELLKQARVLSPDSVEILLTGNIDPDVAIRAINETDIFRYLPKPCPREVWRKAVGDALEQYRLIADRKRLTLELEQKNRALARKGNLLAHELETAKFIYSKINDENHDNLDGLAYFISAKESVGGDFILTHADRDNQVFYFMLGDVTGHGLQSALAVLLVAEVFDAACAARPGVERLAEQINDKMCGKLPTGLFCAALLAELDFAAGCLRIWQGGLPDAYLLDDEGRVLKSLPSNQLPLGVLAHQDYAGTVYREPLSAAAALWACSDGLGEQVDLAGEMFGVERLQVALRRPAAGLRRIDAVLAALREHQGPAPQSDDIILAELVLSRIGKALRGG